MYMKTVEGPVGCPVGLHVTQHADQHQHPDHGVLGGHDESHCGLQDMLYDVDDRALPAIRRPVHVLSRPVDENLWSKAGTPRVQHRVNVIDIFGVRSVPPRQVLP